VTPRCLECKRNFNRQASVSKLWCTECEAAKEAVEKSREKPPGRTLQDQLTESQRRKKYHDGKR